MESYPSFYNLSEHRYSCRKFTNAPISRDLIIAALDATRLAPSACNRQPWKFLVVDTPVFREKIQKSYNRDWFHTAPVYIIAVGLHDEAWHRQFDGKDHTDIDVAIAVEHLCLALSSLKLGNCWVCNFDPEIIKTTFSLSENEEPIAIIPVGYPDGDVITDKTRKPLEEIVKWVN